LEAEATLHMELRNGKPGVGGPGTGRIQ